MKPIRRFLDNKYNSPQHGSRTRPLTRILPYLQIQKAKAERQRERILKEEMDAKRAKNKALRERRAERVEAKRNALAGEAQE